MAASLSRRLLCLQRKPNFYRQFLENRKVYYSSTGVDDDTTDSLSKPETDAGVKALHKFDQLVEKIQNQKESVKETADVSGLLSSINVNKGKEDDFAKMIRESKLVSLGEYNGRLVQGNVIEVMGDDLYIDFGGKFHCVCPKPKIKADLYRRGTKVLLRLNCLEMSSSFLGSDKHITLLEGDATLLGISTAVTKGIQRSRTKVSLDS